MRANLYLVVHHRKDRNQTYANHWLDEDRLATITTTKEVASFCQEAAATGQKVHFHRCAFGNWPAAICSSASVAEVIKINANSWMVRFAEHDLLNIEPTMKPIRGQNSYHQ